MNKTIETEVLSVIKFTEDEAQELGLHLNDKYTIKEDNGRLVLIPYAEVEIDLEQFDRETLIHLITLSVERDVSVNEVIESLLQKMLDKENE